MNSEEVKELIASEQKFLHDISNHIVVANGMLGLIQQAIAKEALKMEKKEADRLEKAVDAIAKMTDALRARREHLRSMPE